jgi:hypothetical protein
MERKNGEQMEKKPLTESEKIVRSMSNEQVTKEGLIIDILSIQKTFSKNTCEQIKYAYDDCIILLKLSIEDLIKEKNLIMQGRRKQ